MILNLPQIAEFIENPANRDLIGYARKYSDTCNLHVNGEGIDEFFEQIKDYENITQLKLRKDYAKSNKYLFDQLLRPLDKVYTARGGAKYYNIGGSDYYQETQFKSKLSNIRNGMSLEKWCQETWLKKRIIDPNGVLMLEVSKDGRQCYPTYKSIHTIRDYKYSGLKVEYVIFEPEIIIEGEKEIRKYRVVDDVWDYIIIESQGPQNETSNKTYSISLYESFKHGFESVPGMMVASKEHDSKGYKLSLIDSQIELAKEILIDNSIKVIFKFTQGFPAYWEVERTCPVCKGEGKLNGVDCTFCSGAGVRIRKDVSDKIIVTLDESGKIGAVPPVGYESADVDTWKQMNIEYEMMEKIIHKSMWGTMAFVSERNYEKATGVINDFQPAYDRLTPVSNEAENVEKFFTDLMGWFYFKFAYRGSTVIYGKRFQIESPDQLMEKFVRGKEGKIPWQVLINIFMEWIQSTYENDPFEMSRQIKIFRLDPYPCYTAGELKEIMGDSAAIKKISFEQWINQISTDEIIFQDMKLLSTNRDLFINQNLTYEQSLQRSSQVSLDAQRN